jgi:hypothetical protein
MKTNRVTALLTALVVACGALALTVPAQAASGGNLRIEPGWYAGHEVTFLQPSVFSAKPNGGTFFCFGLGPDLSGIDRPTAPLYVILDDSATQDHCDGQPTTLRHDHVLSVAPGDPGYTGAWTIVLLVAGPGHTLDLANSPITSAAEVRAAMDSGLLAEVPTDGPFRFVGPVIGGS